MKRKKNSRMRGSKTHGGGAMKKRRGAGHRGGRGAAGSGKRGDAKKPSIWKNPLYSGKRGFTPKNQAAHAPITIAHLEGFAKSLLAEGLLTIKEGVQQIDLGSAGYTKLLATGNATKKWCITVPQATASAIAKVKKAGGTVTVTSATTDDAGNEEQ